MAVLCPGHDRVQRKVLSYTNGLDQATFIADGRTYDATLRNLELIGEAATHIPSRVNRICGENYPLQENDGRLCNFANNR